MTVDKKKFELTQAVEENCKCRSRHRFMIATTAIRYELTARSSTNLHIALRISWSLAVHIIHDLRHRRCRHLRGFKTYSKLLHTPSLQRANQARTVKSLVQLRVSETPAQVTTDAITSQRRQLSKTIASDGHDIAS